MPVAAAELPFTVPLLVVLILLLLAAVLFADGVVAVVVIGVESPLLPLPNELVVFEVVLEFVDDAAGPLPLLLLYGLAFSLFSSILSHYLCL